MHKNDHFVRKRHILCNKKQEKRPAQHPLFGQVERVQGVCFSKNLWLFKRKPHPVSACGSALRNLPLQALARDRFSRDTSEFRFFPSFCWAL